jgi:hypothetical protein
MQLRADVDRIEILDRLIDMMSNALPNNTFKLLVDYQTMAQLIERDPPRFIHDGREGMTRYKDIPIEKNYSVSGIWIQLH